MEKILLGILSMLVFALGCSDEKNIRAYYFPVMDLQDGLVYCYEGESNGQSDRECWYFNSAVSDTGLFLTGAKYNKFYEIEQIVSEEIVDNGVIARNYFLFYPDSIRETLMRVEANLTQPNTFPFEVRDSSGVFLFSLDFHPPGDTLTRLYLIRNRRYLGEAPDFTFGGKKYPCVRFRVQEAIGNDREGAAETEGIGEEWYAKNLGLVFYQRSFANGAYQYEFRLKERISMKEMEKRFMIYD